MKTSKLGARKNEGQGPEASWKNGTRETLWYVVCSPCWNSF